MRIVEWVFALLVLLAAAAHPALAREAANGERISVEVVGAGKDVILIPGLGSQPRVWASTIKAVPGYRYHLVHVAGFAGKPAAANAEGPVLEPVAHAIYEYIAASKLKKPAIIGHSMGGTLALILASHHPEAVGRLMVVDMLPFLGPMVGGPNATPESVKPIAEGIKAQMTSGTPESAKAGLEATMKGMTIVEAERPALVADSLASDRMLVGRSFYELFTTDLRPDLARITAPTTVLYVTPAGAPLDDAQMDAFYTSSYAGLAGATLTRVPNAAHFIMFDAPERFQSEVRAFLD